MRAVSDAQVRKLMEEMSKRGKVGQAAMMANMDRKTARKYVKAAALPTEMVAPRTWRTRNNPFEADWPQVEQWLQACPEFDGKSILALLEHHRPGHYQSGQLRTLQRHMRRWRAARGPEQEIFFAQAHRPGEAAQSDFTAANELEVTVAGKDFPHMLCVWVLPYSNWQWATVCYSESLAALKRNVQAALFQLGRVPKRHQTDNSTAATHRISAEAADRGFNAEYIAIMDHFGMQPWTTQVGAKEQNGDVEASHRALKYRLNQALLIRGHRDFADVAAWEQFVQDTLRRANMTRLERLGEEMGAMRVLDVSKLPDYQDVTAKVTAWSTIRVHHCSYSVPSRLIGETVRVRLYEDRIEAYYAGSLQLKAERLRQAKRHRIDYRHVIWSLVQKPGAFARYVYRDEMFPTLVFRRAYDAISAAQPSTRGDLEYLRILHLAASQGQDDTEAALMLLAEQGVTPTADVVKALVLDRGPQAPPVMAPPKVDLRVYDGLLSEVNS